MAGFFARHSPINTWKLTGLKPSRDFISELSRRFLIACPAPVPPRLIVGYGLTPVVPILVEQGLQAFRHVPAAASCASITNHKQRVALRWYSSIRIAQEVKQHQFQQAEFRRRVWDLSRVFSS
ncbi:MAG: hypothetical protein AB7P14_12205 [Blastocatellales bacterium]